MGQARVSNTDVFARIKLNESELKAAYDLTQIQVAAYKNLICDIMEEKLNLTFTPNDVLTYTQQEAYLRGQMDSIKYILSLYEEQSRFINLDLASQS